MIELVVLNYLKSALNVPVVMEKPIGAISEYVLIEKTGSGQSNHINTATFAIQSWSDSLYNACLLNESVKEAMIGNGIDEYGIVSSDKADISKCELNSDYNYTDTTTKSYRYQAVFDLVF